MAYTTVKELMTAICGKIRGYLNVTDKIHSESIPQKIDDVYHTGYGLGFEEGKAAGLYIGRKEGKQAEYDAFWDVFQNYGKRSHYVYGFAYGGFDNTNYNPKYHITPAGSNGLAYMFFWNDKVTDTKVPITAFGNCSNAFANASRIKRIPKLIFDGTTSVSSMFLNTSELEELNCEGELSVSGLNLQSCTKLNKASIESVLNVLSYTTNGLFITLSKVAVDKAFETAEGANDGSESDEWLTWMYSLWNWAISLV